MLLDVTIHDFPCIDLSLDYQDVTRKLRNSFVAKHGLERFKGFPVEDKLLQLGDWLVLFCRVITMYGEG